jgi:hypothetical protein
VRTADARLLGEERPPIQLHATARVTG